MIYLYLYISLIFIDIYIYIYNEKHWAGALWLTLDRRLVCSPDITKLK